MLFILNKILIFRFQTLFKIQIFGRFLFRIQRIPFGKILLQINNLFSLILYLAFSMLMITKLFFILIFLCFFRYKKYIILS